LSVHTKTAHKKPHNSWKHLIVMIRLQGIMGLSQCIAWLCYCTYTGDRSH